MPNAGWCGSLPASGRKLLLTNAPLDYAGSVLRELSLHRHFGTRYSIERMRVHGTYRPKPSRLMLRSMLARERIRPSAAVLVEDSVLNLKAARSLGIKTVLITRHGASAARRSPGGAAGLRISSLHELARRFPALTPGAAVRFGKLRVPSPTLHVEPVWHGPD